MKTFDQHLENVYTCQLCQSGFSRSPNGTNYRFPPLIGAVSRAKLLFVGINPRISKSNQLLHDRLINSEESFCKLAHNRLDDGSSYISLKAKEKHYHSHMLVVHGVFGENCAFEKVAAVTELFLCASTSSPAALKAKSICGQNYLHTSINLVKPQVVIAVGSMVQTHLETYFYDLLPMHLVKMEHPRFHFDLSLAEKRRRLQPTIDEVNKFVR